MTRLGILLFFVVPTSSISADVVVTSQARVSTDNTPYQTYVLGWDVKFYDLSELTDTVIMSEITTALREQLRVVNGVLPQPALNNLQTRVEIKIDSRCDWGARAVYFSAWDDILFRCYEYALALLKYSDPCLYVEAKSSYVCVNEVIVLHEIAHAFHDIFVKDGFQNECIRESYARAVDFYDSDVEPRYQGNRDEYWRSNPKEFFADFSVMLWHRHWDEPLTRHRMNAYFREPIRSLWLGKYPPGNRYSASSCQ